MKKNTLLRKLSIAAFLAVFMLSACEKENGNNGDDNNNDIPKTTADFSEIEIEEESYWNGSDESGGFTSGNIFFPNYFTDWGDGVVSWSGFSVSNITDNETPGFANQYSAFTGSGYEENANYAVVYVSDPETFESHMKFELVGKAIGNNVEGLYITNSTWAALTIKDGDEYTEPFSQGDYFKVTFTGYFEEEVTSSVDFYLADYTAENADSHYIVSTWEWIDLTTLGDVDEIKISLTSTDMGDWGMQTPAYICIGQVVTLDE